MVLLQARAPIVATFRTHLSRATGDAPYRRWAALMRRVRLRLAVSEAARRTVALIFSWSLRHVPSSDVDRFHPAARPPRCLKAGDMFCSSDASGLARGGSVDCASTVQRITDAQLVVVGEADDRAALEAAARRARVGRLAGRVATRCCRRNQAADPSARPRSAKLRHRPARGDGAGHPVVATRIADMKNCSAEAVAAARRSGQSDRARAGDRHAAFGSTLPGARGIGRRLRAPAGWTAIARR